MTITLYIELAGGFIYLLFGADLLVRGSVSLARRLHVPPVVIALTVVAFGTSLPELVVAVRAALTGFPTLVLGNVVGSNIANVLLVGGVTALVYPLRAGEGTVRRDSAAMVGASVLFFALCLTGTLSLWMGLLLLAVLLIISTITGREAAQEYRKADVRTPIEWVLGLPSAVWLVSLFIVLGLVGLPLGAKMVVESATEIATQWGVSEAVIGLTVIAFSTSLPELATTVVTAIQRRTEMAMGAIIGSNFFNLLAVMGVGVVASPVGIPVPHGFLLLDLPLMVASSLALCLYIWRGRAIGRVSGALFAAAYVGYVAVLLVLGPAAA